MRFRDLFRDPAHDVAWLQRLRDELQGDAYLLDWTVEDQVLCCRPAHDAFPKVWVRSGGQVDVVAFEGDVDHPGFKLKTAQVHPRQAAQVIAEVIDSNGERIQTA
jgi:hypothetical protein